MRARSALHWRAPISPIYLRIMSEQSERPCQVEGRLRQNLTQRASCERGRHGGNKAGTIVARHPFSCYYDCRFDVDLTSPVRLDTERHSTKRQAAAKLRPWPQVIGTVDWFGTHWAAVDLWTPSQPTGFSRELGIREGVEGGQESPSWRKKARKKKLIRCSRWRHDRKVRSCALFPRLPEAIFAYLPALESERLHSHVFTSSPTYMATPPKITIDDVRSTFSPL